jgi:5-methylcytosine-specific restriction endonuclease McrA
MTSAEAKRQWRQDIKAQFNNRCVYCGSTDNLTIDHVKARTHGGKDEARNLIPACRHCNQSKGSAHWLSWWVGQESFNLSNFKLILEYIN